MGHFALAAGHGGYDPGAVNGSRKEKDDNLKLCLLVGSKLLSLGHRVDYYRTDDSPCPAGACREWIKSKQADFALCFHRNSFSGSASGVEVWTNSDDLSASLGKELAAAIAAAGEMYNRSRKGGGAAWITPAAPCAEPEVGFISSAEDNLKFDRNIDKIADSIVAVLEGFFGKAEKGEPIGKAITTAELHLRTGPATTNTSLTVMPKGAEVLIYGIENGWANVSFGDKSGYSFTRYMKIEYLPTKEDAVDGEEDSTSLPEKSDTIEVEEKEDNIDIDIEAEEAVPAKPSEDTAEPEIESEEPSLPEKEEIAEIPTPPIEEAPKPAKDGTLFQKIGRAIRNFFLSVFKK